jgi:hypothetical protein
MPAAVQMWIMKNSIDKEFEEAYKQEKEKIEKMNRDVAANGKKSKHINLRELDNKNKQ